MKYYLQWTFILMLSLQGILVKGNSGTTNTNSPFKDSGIIRVIDSCFLIPQLGSFTTVTVYLPPKYATTRKRYPVIYLPELSKQAGAPLPVLWNMPGLLDKFYEAKKQGCIVVGIRLNDTNGTFCCEDTAGACSAYARFLAKTLKPYVDKKFRTIQNKESSILAARNADALKVLHTVLGFPNTFGKAGIFSPRFDYSFVTENKWNLQPDNDCQLFFYACKSEDLTLFNELTDIFGEKTGAVIYKVTAPVNAEEDEEDEEDEPCSPAGLGEFLPWILANGFNYIIKPDQPIL